jgi:hypothetical protein
MVSPSSLVNIAATNTTATITAIVQLSFVFSKNITALNDARITRKIVLNMA